MSHRMYEISVLPSSHVNADCSESQPVHYLLEIKDRCRIQARDVEKSCTQGGRLDFGVYQDLVFISIDTEVSKHVEYASKYREQTKMHANSSNAHRCKRYCKL